MYILYRERERLYIEQTKLHTERDCMYCIEIEFVPQRENVCLIMRRAICISIYICIQYVYRERDHINICVYIHT